MSEDSADDAPGGMSTPAPGLRARRGSAEVTARARPAGVRVVEPWLTHLAATSEAPRAMLPRQPSSAVAAARQRSAEGAGNKGHRALPRLAEQDVVALDEQREAAVVSNLPVVRRGERCTHPVVNTSSPQH